MPDPRNETGLNLNPETRSASVTTGCLTHWKYKLGFGFLVLSGAVFTGVAVNRGIESAAMLQAQLNTIQKNTETPPKVEVNIPSPSQQ